MAMSSPVSRGFRHLRRFSAGEEGRVPPGQYVTQGFPVLSAGPTPHTPLPEWTFSIRQGGGTLKSWTWQVPDSVQPLGSGALVPKQIQFSNDARVLVVDEAGSNTIDTFVVGRDGRPGPAVTTPSVGGGPFGFDFDRAGYLVVADAALTTGQSGATSYDVGRNGAVTANGLAVPIDQAAACWLAAAGSFAFTANAGSGSIGRYAVGSGGTLTALGTTLVGNDSASKPLDEGVSAGQNYLYVLAAGLNQIVGYRVGPDGSLTQVTTVPVVTGSAGVGAS